MNSAVQGLYNQAKPYENRDPRLKASIYYDGSKLNLETGALLSTKTGGNCALDPSNARYTCTGYYTRKFSHYKSGRSGNLDGYFKEFRLAELYLNYAEAIYRYLGAAGATDNEFRMSACAAINKVRQRSDVQMPDFPDNISNTEFWERYKKERMVELAFEQHRFWDVRRWKEGGFTKIGRMQITQKEDGNFLYERTNKSLVWDDKMYFFPIPASEMRKNPNLSQNPGW